MLALTAAVAAPTAATASDETSSETPTDGADALTVVAFNLRFASDEPPNSWPERRPVMAELLQNTQPDIIGTQEGLFEQLNDISEDLGPDYDSIGLGRDGGSHGEFMQIYFNTDRLQLLSYDHYWLSDTPDVIGSQTWEGCCPRMVTQATFLDLDTDEQFHLINTHFEAFDAETRALSADLMLERSQDMLDDDLPILVTGDFNEPADAGETVYDALVTDGPFVDTWETAEERGPAYGTSHGYEELVPDGDQIDWVLSSPQVRTIESHIDTFEVDGQFPSDHLPVYATVELNPEPTTVCERHQGGASFPDAPDSGHHYYIDCLAELGIVEGRDDGTFGPNVWVTRGQLASFAVRAIELATGDELEVGDETFPDVPLSSTHGEAVYKLAEAGVVQGRDDGTFGPDQPVTREQTARYQTNALELVLDERLPRSGQTFSDVPAGSLYASDIDALATAEVATGFSDDTFQPRQPTSRGQMTNFIGKGLEVLEAEGAYEGP